MASGCTKCGFRRRATWNLLNKIKPDGEDWQKRYLVKGRNFRDVAIFWNGKFYVDGVLASRVTHWIDFEQL